MAYYLYTDCKINIPANFSILDTTICQVSDPSNPDRLIVQNAGEVPVYIYFGNVEAGERSIFQFPSKDYRVVRITNIRISEISICCDLHIYEYINGYIPMYIGYMTDESILETGLIEFDKCIKYVFGNEPNEPKIDFKAKKPIIEYEIGKISKIE